VAAGDRLVGVAETPVFGDTGRAPDYVIVRTAPWIGGTFRVVPSAMVDDVDEVGRVVTLAVTGALFAELPERLPLEGR
jgi:hypothetical protein